MRGRYPARLESIDRADGSAEAKRRARLILGTISGDYRMGEVCAELDICQQRFQQLRDDIMSSLVASLERKPPGRRPKSASPEAERIAELEAELDDLRRELQTAQTREEIALILGRRADDAQEHEKKTPAANARRKRRGRPPGKPKST